MATCIRKCSGKQLILESIILVPYHLLSTYYMPVTSYIIVYNHQNNPVRFTNAENKIQKKQLAKFTERANSGTVLYQVCLPSSCSFHEFRIFQTVDHEQYLNRNRIARKTLEGIKSSKMGIVL